VKRESRLQDFVIIKDFQISTIFTDYKIIKAQKNQSAAHVARMESKKGVQTNVTGRPKDSVLLRRLAYSGRNTLKVIC
jgi:hypothetical protein